MFVAPAYDMICFKFSACIVQIVGPVYLCKYAVCFDSA